VPTARQEAQQDVQQPSGVARLHLPGLRDVPHWQQDAQGDVVKLRVSRELHERAKACADAVDARLCAWSQLAIKKARTGVFIGVALDESLLVTTRENSTVITVDGEVEADSYRRVLALAVGFCEARNPKPFIPPAGLRFIIAEQED
jgi:hypothetical protein